MTFGEIKKVLNVSILNLFYLKNLLEYFFTPE